VTVDSEDAATAREGAIPIRGGAGAVTAAVLAYIGAFVTNIGMMAFVAPAQRLLDELCLDKVQFGAVQSAYMAGQVATMWAFSTRLRRLGDRAILAWAFSGLTIGNGIACQGSVAALVAARFLIGSAGASCVFVVSRLTFRHFVHRRTLLVGLAHAAYLGGSLLTMMVGGAWYAHVGTWARLSGQLAMLTFLPLLPLLALCPARRPVEEPEHARKDATAVWRPVAYRLASPAVATYLLGEGALAFFLPLYVQADLGGSPLHVAAAGTLFLTALLVGRVLLCAVLGRVDELRVLPGLVCMAWVSLLGVLLPLPLGGRAVLLALGGFLLGPVAVLEVNVGVRVAGGRLDDAIVVTNVLLSAGGIVGGLLTGWIGERWSLSGAMGFALAASLLAALPLWRIGCMGVRPGV